MHLGPKLANWEGKPTHAHDTRRKLAQNAQFCTCHFTRLRRIIRKTVSHPCANTYFTTLNHKLSRIVKNKKYFLNKSWGFPRHFFNITRFPPPVLICLDTWGTLIVQEVVLNRLTKTSLISTLGILMGILISRP